MWAAVQFDDAAEERIRKAAALEQRLRLQTYLQLPEDLTWCKVRQITPKDCVIFELDENRLFGNGKAKIDDFIHFAFLLRLDTKQSAKKYAKALIRKYRSEEQAIQKTLDFINQSFIDCPSNNSSKAA